MSTWMMQSCFFRDFFQHLSTNLFIAFSLQTSKPTLRAPQTPPAGLQKPQGGRQHVLQLHMLFVAQALVDGLSVTRWVEDRWLTSSGVEQQVSRHGEMLLLMLLRKKKMVSGFQETDALRIISMVLIGFH